jgi:hypothetical protein
MLFTLFSVQGFVAISKIIREIYISIEAGRASSNTKHHFFCASLDYLCFRENFTTEHYLRIYSFSM